jgi:hypothetical protein
METSPDPVPKPPGRAPGAPIIIRHPPMPPPMEIPEIEGTSDEEDDPEIERPPEIVPEKLPPPLPLGPGPSATREGFGQNATGEVTMTDVRRGSDGVLRLRNLAMIENIRRAEDPAWRERLEQQQVLARLGRMFGRAEDPLQALKDHADALKDELRRTPLQRRPSKSHEGLGG